MRPLYLIILSFFLACSCSQLPDRDFQNSKQDVQVDNTKNDVRVNQNKEDQTDEKEQTDAETYISTPKISFPNIFKLIPTR
ncbi:MAG: hypothetical protein CL840_09390 [Crocinitomicaceae bacterium]|nr:hypothetical protein [Crocinitomicaceae bacterium]|tara:strand:- start:9531 stop:9773 length:243 start_codon:yes stop_codon:yes gene_type:complete